MKEDGFTRLIDEFVQSLEIRNLSEGTIKAASWKLGRFVDYLNQCGISHVDGITGDTVRSYQIELYQSINAKGSLNTASYRNNMLSAAKQFLTFLHDRDYMAKDPGKDVQYANSGAFIPPGGATAVSG